MYLLKKKVKEENGDTSWSYQLELQLYSAA